jgi:hypothetical protein
MLQHRFTIALLVLAGLAVPAIGNNSVAEKHRAHKVTLKWKLREGETFYQTMTTDTKRSSMNYFHALCTMISCLTRRPVVEKIIVYGERVMDGITIHQCQCPACVSEQDHSERKLHHQVNLLFHRLDEQQRRWVAALESKKIGHGGDAFVSLITGLHVDTIRRGREELDADLEGRPTDRIRNPGAGRPSVKKKTRRWSKT